MKITVGRISGNGSPIAKEKYNDCIIHVPGGKKGETYEVELLDERAGHIVGLTEKRKQFIEKLERIEEKAEAEQMEKKREYEKEMKLRIEESKKKNKEKQREWERKKKEYIQTRREEAKKLKEKEKRMRKITNSTNQKKKTADASRRGYRDHPLYGSF